MADSNSSMDINNIQNINMAHALKLAQLKTAFHGIVGRNAIEAGEAYDAMIVYYESYIADITKRVAAMEIKIKELTTPAIGPEPAKEVSEPKKPQA